MKQTRFSLVFMPHMILFTASQLYPEALSLGHTMMEPMDRIHETKTHLVEQIFGNLA